MDWTRTTLLPKRSAAICFVAALVLAGCTCSRTAPADRQAASAVSVADYDCGARGMVTVKWTGDMAEVTAPGGSWLLPRARAASGARYADSRHEVWEHKGSLRWTDAGAAPVACRRVGA